MGASKESYPDQHVCEVGRANHVHLCMKRQQHTEPLSPSPSHAAQIAELMACKKSKFFLLTCLVAVSSDISPKMRPVLVCDAQGSCLKDFTTKQVKQMNSVSVLMQASEACKHGRVDEKVRQCLHFASIFDRKKHTNSLHLKVKVEIPRACQTELGSATCLFYTVQIGCANTADKRSKAIVGCNFVICPESAETQLSAANCKQQQMYCHAVQYFAFKTGPQGICKRSQRCCIVLKHR